MWGSCVATLMPHKAILLSRRDAAPPASFHLNVAKDRFLNGLSAAQKSPRLAPGALFSSRIRCLSIPFKMKHELRERHGVVVSRELAGNPTAFDDLGKISFQHDLMRSAVLHVLGAPPVQRWTVTVYLTTELGLSFTLPVWFALSFPVMPIT